MATLKSLVRNGLEQSEIIELLEDEIQAHIETGDLFNMDTEERSDSIVITFEGAGRSWSITHYCNELETMYVSSALYGASSTEPKEMRSTDATMNYIRRLAGI